MGDQHVTSWTFPYFARDGRRISVDLTINPNYDSWFVTWIIIIGDLVTSSQYGHYFFHAKHVAKPSEESKMAICDYIKDLILLGDWRRPVQDFIPNWTDAEREGITIGWEKMKQLGFREIDNSLTYERKVDALAAESDFTRWQILETLYRQPNAVLKENELTEKLNYIPKGVVEREIDILKDLDFLTTVIKGLDRRDASDFRLTAKGRKHYEEHVLPSHNIVFVIAPCREKWFTKSIKRMLEEKGMKYIIQEETEHRQETIREDILANIRSCRFVIAHISGKGIDEGERFNPNCVYELGYAHAQKKRIICSVNKDLVPENGLPFDFAGVRFSFWTRSKSKIAFAKEIKKRIEQVLDQFQREYWPESK